MEKANLSKMLKISLAIALGLASLKIYMSHRRSDLITASVSSVEWREDGLKQVVSDILPQVDRLNVFLQGYQSVPAFLNDPKITVARGQDYPEVLARGSNAKFFWADKVKGYHFIIDDDTLYPADYVKYCIQKIEEYNRTAVVGFHGIQVKDQMKDYFKERSVISLRRALKADTSVHILGSGMLAYHTDTIKINPADFVIKNEDAVYFAINAQKQHVPLICIQRPVYYLKPLGPLCYDERCVYEQALRDGGKQRLALIQTHESWKLYGDEASLLKSLNERMQ